MRQFAKSALSLGWALSLLGAKQAYGLIKGGKQSHGDDFGRVAQAAASQLDESMRRIHRSANTMESRVVDMAFSFMDPTRWMNPKQWGVWNPVSPCGRGADADEPPANADSQASTSAPGEPIGHPDQDNPGGYDSSSFPGPFPGDLS
jgi:hypothetical protein